MHFISFEIRWIDRSERKVEKNEQEKIRWCGVKAVDSSNNTQKPTLHIVGCHRNRIHAVARDHTFATHNTASTHRRIYASAAHTSPHYLSVSLSGWIEHRRRRHFHITCIEEKNNAINGIALMLGFCHLTLAASNNRFHPHCMGNHLTVLYTTRYLYEIRVHFSFHIILVYCVYLRESGLCTASNPRSNKNIHRCFCYIEKILMLFSLYSNICSYIIHKNDTNT